MVAYKDRLAKAMRLAGVSEHELAEALGMTYTGIKKALRGGDKGTSALSTPNNSKAAKLLRVNADWLATGDDDEARARAPSSHTNHEPARPMRADVPLISWVAAGGWCESQDPHGPGEAEKWLACNTPHSKGTYALRVRGTSMVAPYGGKAYPPGSIIFVDPAKRSPSNGERIVAKLRGGDEVTFKTYKHEDGRTWLEALNPTHEPIRGEFEVLGTVIGTWIEE